MHIKKELLKRCLRGAPLGLAINMVITIIISVAVGDGTYHAAVPQLIADSGSEINAVIVQAVLALIYGAAWAGASVIWEVEHWSILKQTVVHLIICSAASFPIAYFAGWMPRSGSGILLFFGMFFVIYLIVWLALYSAMKKRVKEINERLQSNDA
jgi:ABC-type multidrug transport system permease subunit